VSKREKLRFLKGAMIYTLFMATVVTLSVLFICYRAGEISGTVVSALCALWSLELLLGAYIKVAEGKTTAKKKEETEEMTV